MTGHSGNPPDRWGVFRFGVIGGLLAAPPDPGDLQAKLERLAARRYKHPIEGTPYSCGFSSIERWYYKAKGSNDPIAALSRKPRSDLGANRAMSAALLQELKRQYQLYPSWSYKLHSDNLAALTRERPELGDSPSYSTVSRRMKERGWIKKRSRRNKTAGQKRAIARLEQQEVRSYESSYAHALWHLDFHHASEGLRIVDSRGEWHSPIVLAILDDYSRLCCHIQWYLHETADVLVHGVTQGFCKHGFPGSLMSDNGSPMIAGETQNGFSRLGVKHETTLPYSPHQNGKQESFWGTLEGRFVAMLSRINSLSLSKLNYLTQAWVEMEYNRSKHEETNEIPIERALSGKSVARPAWSNDEMEFAFTARESRIQRQSDGTLQLKGVRFEVPSRLRHMRRLYVRYKSWDLSKAWVVDKRCNTQLAVIRPLDKTKNASGRRRALEPHLELPLEEDNSNEDFYPALLRETVANFAATGMPAGYIPKPDEEE